MATTGKRRAKPKRATSVGRTGARFPSADVLDKANAETRTGPDDRSAPEPPTAADRTRPSGRDQAHADRGDQPLDGRALDVRADQASGRRGDHVLDHGWAFAVDRHSPDQRTPAHDRDARASSSPSPSGGAPAPAPAPPSTSSSAVDLVGSLDGKGDGHGEDDRPVGARFGSTAARKPKRAKEFDTGSTPVIDDGRPATPPGEPTPEQSAERTEQMVMPWSGALVRPYAHTGGRTRSSHDLAIEALVSTSQRAVGPALDEVLTSYHRRVIVDMCAVPRSVAEVAALLAVPLGVARVLLGDLAAAGVVTVHPTAGSSGDGAPDLEFMRRVLVGLRRL